MELQALSTQDYWTVREVADHWRVSVRVVRHQIDKGAIAAIKVGKEYRIARIFIDRYGSPPSS